MTTVSGNPLLVGWLKEIYDFSKEKGTKGVTTYKKAYESMKACPLTFNHPSEAIQLDGIGPKLCERLTKKLAEHCATNGLPMPTMGKRKRQSGTDGANDAEEDESPVPAKKPRKKKPYIPALRSGPYALVLALSSLPEDSLQSLSKAELQVLAQPHCDSSFTVPSEANKFYTAWSSMKTLVEKDLVQERGRPTRKYNLSDEGWEVARRIKAAQEKNGGSAASIEVSQETGKICTKRPPTTATRPESTSQDFLQLDEDSEWEQNAEFVDKEVLRTYPRGFGAGVTGSKSEATQFGARAAFQRSTAPSTQEREARATAEAGFIDLLSSPENPLSKPRPPSQITQAKTQVPTNSVSSKSTTASFSTTDRDHHVSQPNGLTVPTSRFSDFSSFEPFEVSPGTFTVELVLDTREVRTKSDREYIHDELVKNGIKPILRALELGDFFWVAKLKNPGTLASHGEATADNSDELTLDYIVERKRLDDLVGSIKDGRLNEQKFRLKKSGIKNVIYLIEEFSLGTANETFHQAIQTIIASTQVVDGSFVKRTQKLDETIRYIAHLTRLLKDLYEPKPLYLIPSKTLDGDNYLPLLQHLRTHPAHQSRSYHLTYPTFAALVSKTDNLTLRDVFVRMLMCLRGVSADKALAMQKVWTTPRALMEAYEVCATEKERHGLVAEKLAGAVGRAQVKRMLSEKVAGVWGVVG